MLCWSTVRSELLVRPTVGNTGFGTSDLHGAALPRNGLGGLALLRVEAG